MSWRDRYQSARYRSAEFLVRQAATQAGRRTVVHEYPQRDTPYPEDMGRAARRFTLEALVAGPDYDLARDALIAALETPGPGLLVHPYYGRRMVALASPAKIAESPADEGGIARFTLEFVEAGDEPLMAARVDSRSRVDAAATRALGAVAQDFAARHDVSRAPAFVAATAMDRVGGVLAALESVRRAMIPDLSLVADYVQAAQMLAGGLAGVIRAPVDLAERIMGLVAGVRGLAVAPLEALGALRKLLGAESHAPLPTQAGPVTPSRARTVANDAALGDLLRRAALIEMVQAAAQLDFDSYDQAAALRDELAERLDDEAATADEGVYAALLALRVAMVADIGQRGADLARIGYVTLPATLPALVVAHRVYGDARREGEVVTRNPVVQHPGFVPGGVELEILRA